ncbi:MAG: DNA starvation/stationary phase protection protein [Chitinophagales bacterium]|nr:DNA starvation/stationary phase protection protein [Chitinophagales bacterium]
MNTTALLNQLLSDYQIHYQNLRGFHWNIKGPKFFELHAKFEELYNDAQLKIDEIAERILTLKGRPLHSFSDYTEHANLKEVKNVSEAQQCMQCIVENMSYLVTLQNQILEQAASVDDKGTEDMMTQYIAFHEKTLWMFNAWLG